MVAQFGASGTGDWQTKLCATGTDEVSVEGLGALSGGDAIAAGYFSGTLTAGNTTLVSAGDQDIFVARLSGSTGSVVWAVRYGSTGPERALAVAVDSSDRINVGGWYLSPAIAVGTTTLATGTGGNTEGFVFQLNTNGVPVWAVDTTPTPTSVTGTARVNGLATDASGNIAIVGYFSNQMSFPGLSGNIVAGGGADGYVASLTSAGVGRWATNWGNPTGSQDVGNAIAVDASGNVYMTGSGTGNMTIGSALTAVGAADVIVGKFNGTTGAAMWGKLFGGLGNDYGNGIAVDSSGSILVGITTGTVGLTLGSFTPTCTTCGGNDIVTAKLSQADGTVLTAKRFGGPAADQCYDLAAFSLDELVAGYFFTSFTVNGVTLSGQSGNADAFLVRTIVTP